MSLRSLRNKMKTEWGWKRAWAAYHMEQLLSSVWINSLTLNNQRFTLERRTSCSIKINDHKNQWSWSRRDVWRKEMWCGKGDVTSQSHNDMTPEHGCLPSFFQVSPSFPYQASFSFSFLYPGNVLFFFFHFFVGYQSRDLQAFDWKVSAS